MINNRFYRLAYEFHQKWSPYPVTLDDWSRCADEMAAVAYANGNDELLIDLFVAVYGDLVNEYKAAEKRGELKSEGI